MKIKLFGRTLFEIRAATSPLPPPRDDGAWSAYLAGRGYPMSAEEALKISAVFRCVDIISKTIAALPLHMFKNTDRGKEKATRHRVYRLVYTLPNPQTTAYEFWQMYVANLLLTRGAFAKIEREPSGYIKALWNIPTGAVSGIHVNEVSGERYIDVSLGNGQYERLREGEFFYTPGFLLDDRHDAKDPIVIAGNVLGLTATVSQYAASSVNGVSPGGFIEYPKALSEPAYERLKADFEANYRGAINAGKFIFLEEGGKAALFDRDLEKMQVLESRKYAVTEVSRIFGVPPHLVMDMEHATFSNIEQQSLEYVRDCVDPMAVRLEQCMFRDLLTENERLSYFFKFNLNGLLRGDTQTRANFYSMMHQNGIFNADEIRALEDMDMQPDGQGEIYMVNGNMIARKNVPLNIPKGAQNAVK